MTSPTSARRRLNAVLATLFGGVLLALTAGEARATDGSKGIDPQLARLCQTSFPGRSIEKASIYAFLVQANRSGLIEKLGQDEAVEQFRRLQDAAIGSHFNRTRNLLFTAPVPAYPWLNMRNFLRNRVFNDAPLFEQEPNDRPWNANPMTCADTMDGGVSPTDEEDWIRLQVATTEIYDITATSSSDVRLSVYDSGLNRIAFNDDAVGTDPAVHLTLPAGDYYLVVDAHDPTVTAGYQIQITCAPEMTIGPNATVGGNFQGQAVDTYTLTLAQDSLVSLNAAPTAGSPVDPAIAVCGPNGFDKIAANNDGLTPPISDLEVHLPAGTHYLHVSEKAGALGTYTLTTLSTPTPIINLVAGQPAVTFQRASTRQYEMVRIQNAAPAEILSRAKRDWLYDVGVTHVFADEKLSTMESSAKNLTGAGMGADTEQYMGLPQGTFYLILDPTTFTLRWPTRNFARQLSYPDPNHPGPFRATLSGSAGFLLPYLNVGSNTVRVRMYFEGRWNALAKNHSWWFDQAVLNMRDATTQTVVPALALQMTHASTAPTIFNTEGENSIAGGVLDQADGQSAACYWVDNFMRSDQFRQAVDFEFQAPTNIANIDQCEVQVLCYLSGNDASQPTSGVPTGSNPCGITNCADARTQIFNVTTGLYEEMNAEFQAVNSGTTWLNPLKIPFSTTVGDFGIEIHSTARTIHQLGHMGQDFTNVVQSQIGQQNFFAYESAARGMHRIRTTPVPGGTFTDPQAYSYDPSGHLISWVDDRINGTLRDPDLFVPVGRGSYLIVTRSWDNCCTGSFNFVPRSRDFNALGPVARGQTVTLDIASPPNSIYTTYAAAALFPIAIPLDGMGLTGDLVLDPATLSQLFTGMAPASLPITIPNMSVLQGARVYLQTVILYTPAPFVGVMSQDLVLEIQ